MRKTKKPEEGGGGSWMDTYGDLVTLLLCFFVLLFAFSTVDAAKWEAIVKSFSGSSGIFEGQGEGYGVGAMPIITQPAADETGEKPSATPSVNSLADPTPTPTPTITVKPTVTKKPSGTPAPTVTDKIYADLKTEFSDLKGNPAFVIEKSGKSIRIRIMASILFEHGSDQLTAGSQDILKRVSATVSEYSSKIKSIHTEGHTDTLPDLNGDISSKWELAARRAAKVMNFICLNSKFDITKAYTVGYGSVRPIASNKTEAGRDQNNRVDIVISG